MAKTTVIGAELMDIAENRGWLKENYRIFYATEKRDMDFQAHFHEFHKIVFCLNGHVTYAAEGKTFRLEPGDLLIIPAHCIHRSSIRGDDMYERVILWIDDSYVANYNEPAFAELFGCPLLLHADSTKKVILSEMLKTANRCVKNAFPGHLLLSETYVIQFMITVSQMIRSGSDNGTESVRSDRRMNEVIEFINANLAEKLSVEEIAARFFLSPSRLSQQFKEYNGCSIHQYIIQKRMIHAADAIRNGTPVIQAARNNGCEDYSAFLRAFKKAYGCTPGDMKKQCDSRNIR